MIEREVRTLKLWGSKVDEGTGQGLIRATGKLARMPYQAGNLHRLPEVVG